MQLGLNAAGSFTQISATQARKRSLHNTQLTRAVRQLAPACRKGDLSDRTALHLASLYEGVEPRPLSL